MITFKPIEKSDLQLLKEWRNSVSVRPYVREYRLLNDSDQEAWYNSYISSRRKSDFDQEINLITSINKVRSRLQYSKDKLVETKVGVGGFTRIEWRNQRAELTFYSIHGKFIQESILSLLNKGFNEFNFHKITWPVYSHDPNLKIYQSIFKTEAILKDEYYWDGSFQDRIYLSLLKKDYLDVYK